MMDSQKSFTVCIVYRISRMCLSIVYEHFRTQDHYFFDLTRIFRCSEFSSYEIELRNQVT